MLFVARSFLQLFFDLFWRDCVVKEISQSVMLRFTGIWEIAGIDWDVRDALMFPLPPRPIEIRCGGDTIGCSPLLLLLVVMACWC